MRVTMNISQGGFQGIEVNGESYGPYQAMACASAIVVSVLETADAPAVDAVKAELARLGRLAARRKTDMDIEAGRDDG